jgi:mRNA-degrading endonuclease toxin of MazEF toxin-antitoxin module
MPAHPDDLRRGRIVYGLFPFVAKFPASTADGKALESIEALARAHRGDSVSLVVEARLRPVLLLHDGTRGEHADVACVRINTVKDQHRRDKATWERIAAGEHPFFVHLPGAVKRYGLRADSLIAVAAVGTVHKSALLGPPVGGLSADEMRIVGERLARALQLDLAPLVAQRARELLEAAGLSLSN